MCQIRESGLWQKNGHRIQAREQARYKANAEAILEHQRAYRWYCLSTQPLGAGQVAFGGLFTPLADGIL